MVVVPPYTQEIRLLWRNGAVLRFSSVLEAARYARATGLLPRYSEGVLGEAFGPTRRSLVPGPGCRFEWTRYPPHVVCCTEFGEPISSAALYLALQGPRRTPWWWVQRPEDYRRAPVPGVHKFHGSSYFRHPKTRRDLEDRARYDDELQDVAMSSQKVGRVRKIVSAWDDIPRHLDNNWKRHRLTQYRA